MLAAVVGKYAEYAQDRQNKRQMFDVQKRLVDETINIQKDFETRREAEPLGAPNFTQDIAAAYDTRHTQMVKELRDQGYSDDAINEFQTRLGTIRSQYVAKAIDFQDKSNFALALNNSDQMITSVSQYVSANPNDVQSGLDEFKSSLTHLGLDPIEQASIYDKGKGPILKAAQQGFAIQHPDVVLGLFGLPNEIKTNSPAALPNGQQFSLPTYLQKLGPAEGTGKNKRSSARGFGQFIDSTWLGTYKQVYGDTGETDAQILAKKTDLAVATKLTEKLTSENIKVLEDADKPINDTTVYLAHFLNPKVAISVLSAHADTSIDKLVSAKAREANPDVFKKVKTAGDLIAWAEEKMGGVDATSTGAPANGLTPEDVASLKESWDKATPETAPALFKDGQKIPFEQFQAMAHAPGTDMTAVAETRTQMSKGVVMDAQGKTGIPVLDLASGDDRLAMLVTARTIFNEREADAMHAQREAHDQWYNGFLNKLEDGTLGQADLDNAYKSGQITDYDERSKAQGIIDAKNKKTNYLSLFGTMLASGQKFNPYDDEAQKAVDAGFEKALTYKENGQSPDPFTTALVAWRKTGILPTQGGVMLRGALVGTDPKQVAAAASVASNMLKQNPNAFAGVTGGDEIGKAAETYAHYVDDLGMSAEEAANKIATMNSPEAQVKVQANSAQRNAFEASIVGDKTHPGINIEKTINDAIFGPRGWGSTLTFGAFDQQRGGFTESQKAEAKQTFLELALDHFDKYHDAGAAQAYAAKQMTRFYGVEGKRLMKYPPTKAYPQIMGSREYIYDQAANAVSKQVGFTVPPKDIILQPTASGSTAEAFRSGKAPPYEINYVTHDENGQTVYHHIPGKVFVADIDEARKDAAKKARIEEQRIRANRAAISSVIRAKGGG
jgi:hypothetical protein